MAHYDATIKLDESISLLMHFHPLIEKQVTMWHIYKIMVSKIEKLVQNSAKSLYDAGLIDVTTMREFEVLKKNALSFLAQNKSSIWD